MKPQCRQAVGQALGREVTVAESRNLERRLADALRREAAVDPKAWQALSQGEQLQAGAASAARELIAEAQRKKVRLAQTIVAHDRMRNFVASQLAAGMDTNGFDAISRMLASKSDGKNSILSVEDIGHGIEMSAMGDLFDTWETVHSNFADIINGAMGRESQTTLEGLLVRALHGENVGRPEIMKAAQAFHDVAERLRTRFNAAGGEIGRLDNWGMPHSWSGERVEAAGRQHFVDTLLPMLDRSKYVHEDGRLYTDTDLQGLLGHAYQSIVTNGANKPLSEVRKAGMRAGRHAESRQIHFRDGDSAHKALAEFSGSSVLSGIANHVKRMASDIALIEQFGPNPDLAVAKLLEELGQSTSLTGSRGVAEAFLQTKRVENLYDYLSGNAEAPLQVPLFKIFGWDNGYTVGNLFQDLRNINVASKLGSAVLTSITDAATMHLTAHYNGIPPVKLFLNQLHTLNPADQMERRMAGRMGLLTHTMLDELTRWGSNELKQRKTGKLAASLIRASGLNSITEARRRAYSLSMMDTLGALTREHATLASMEAGDHTFLKRTGITEDHWAIWKLAQPDSWRGNDTVLNAASIYRIPDADIHALLGPTSNAKLAKDKAASALMGFVRREQDIAVVEPGARERAMVSMGLRPGTWKGELMRSFFLFKSFPIAMFSRHLRRAFGSDLSKWNKAIYFGTLMASTTLMGAVAMEINEMVSGRDPRSLNPESKHSGKSWVSGMLKGGALGIYGDLLFSDPTQSGQGYVGQALGPVASTVEGLGQLTIGNLNQKASGQKTDAGAELVRFAKGQTPFANLWYTKAATDHLIFQQMQEYFSPGYLRRMKTKAQKDYGSTYWWEPGKTEPTRAPELGRATDG